MEVGGWFWMILDVLGAVILAAALILRLRGAEGRRARPRSAHAMRRCAKIIVAAAKDHKAALVDIYSLQPTSTSR